MKSIKKEKFTRAQIKKYSRLNGRPWADGGGDNLLIVIARSEWIRQLAEQRATRQSLVRKRELRIMNYELWENALANGFSLLEIEHLRTWSEAIKEYSPDTYEEAKGDRIIRSL